jgi:hypothetical protein
MREWRVARRAVAVLLIVEGLLAGVRVVTEGPTLVVVYPWTVIGLAVVRAGVSVAQFASGWMLWDRSAVGPALGRLALLASAGLLTIELGFGAAPTSVFPSYRWPAVAAYWVYALAGTWVLGPRRSV